MPRIGTFALALAALWHASGSSGQGGDAATEGSSPIASGAPPAAAPSPAAPPASALFVLGDSLSDIGNAAGAADYLLGSIVDTPAVGLCNAADVWIVPRPCDDLFYRQSRVTDGPVAIEHLAAHLGLAELEPSLYLVPGRDRDATVYAVAGAKASANGDADLARQLDWLLLDHAPLPADAVYVVMIGGNDALNALQEDAAAPAANPRPSARFVTAAVAGIGASVERLLDFGAQRIVVANVPDLAALPAIRAAAGATPHAGELLAHASAISAAFDAQLNATLDAIEASRLSPTASIIRFDLRAALLGLEQDAVANGRNAYDACFDSDAYRVSGTAERAFHPACTPAAPGEPPRFAEFVFWDGIHPSGAAHAQLGAALSALF